MTDLSYSLLVTLTACPRIYVTVSGNELVGSPSTTMGTDSR
jgi:hypothetical protein